MTVSESSLHNYELLDPDMRLMLQVRDDNATAFEELVLRYQNRLISILQHLVAGREQAEDLAQEVFLSVFESIKDLKEEIKFEAWLTQITLNHCRDRWKYLKRRQYFNSDSLDDPIETEDGSMPRAIVDSSDNPETLYEKKSIQQFIQRGLMKLKEDQRELIVLRDLQGFSYEGSTTIPQGSTAKRLEAHGT